MEIRELIHQRAVEAIIANDYQGACEIAPRVGKTKIAITAIGTKWEEWNTAIYTPRQDINNTWTKEFVKWGMTKFPTPQCFASLKKLEEGVDLLVVDEYHMLSKRNMEIIRAKKPKRVLYLSGFVNGETEAWTQHLLDVKTIFYYPIPKAIEDGIISNFSVKIVRVPMNETSKTVKIKAGDRVFWVTEVQNYTYYTELINAKPEAVEYGFAVTKKPNDLYVRRRASAIYEGESKILVAKYIQEQINHRLLVFTARTKVADRLAPYSYHTKNKKGNNLQRFIDEEINTLSVVNMSDMGITFPNLKHELVHQLQTNSETAIQRFLRTCNLEGDREAVIIVLVYKDTIDEDWAKQAIEGIPSDKITWLEMDEVKGFIEKLS